MSDMLRDHFIHWDRQKLSMLCRIIQALFYIVDGHMWQNYNTLAVKDDVSRGTYRRTRTRGLTPPA